MEYKLTCPEEVYQAYSNRKICAEEAREHLYSLGVEKKVADFNLVRVALNSSTRYHDARNRQLSIFVE